MIPIDQCTVSLPHIILYACCFPLQSSNMSIFSQRATREFYIYSHTKAGDLMGPKYQLKQINDRLTSESYKQLIAGRLTPVNFTPFELVGFNECI